MPHTLGTIGTFINLPINIHLTLQLHDITTFEIQEQQRCPWLTQQITQRIVIAVTAIIGDGKPVAFDMDETRLSTSSVTAPIRGLLRITAPLQFGRLHVAPLVLSFLDAYPQTQAEIVLHDRNLDLIDERLDVAFRIGTLSDSSLVVRKVGEDC